MCSKIKEHEANQRKDATIALGKVNAKEWRCNRATTS
jgi:hypothetical protein